jgi:UDP-glucose 4-epimerase
MKIIITGVAGFIGSNLASALLTLGHEVIGIDNLSHGSLSNIENLLLHKDFTFVQENLNNEAVLRKLKGDSLVHLASQKIPRYTNALITLEENSSMVKNVLKKCLDDKIRLVFASTSDIYGKNPDIPYKETSDSLLGPTTVKRWAYAISKIYSEQSIIANNAEYGLEYTIMRFFGSYGPNQNLTWWGGPQSVFIANTLLNKPLEIHGTGSQSRTFTYIDDTVQGILKCIFEEKAKNEIFNIANNPEEEITILELGKLIWNLINGPTSKPLINLIPYETFGNYEDVKRRVPNIEKIKTQLDFDPKTSLKEGMLKTIDWQKNISQHSA